MSSSDRGAPEEASGPTLESELRGVLEDVEVLDGAEPLDAPTASDLPSTEGPAVPEGRFTTFEGRRERVRWAPSVWLAAWVLFAGIFGYLAFREPYLRAEGRARALKLELEERSRAARALREEVIQVLGDTPAATALAGQLGGIVVPEPPSAPVTPLWPAAATCALAVLAALWAARRYSVPLARLERALREGAASLPLPRTAELRSLARAMEVTRAREGEARASERARREEELAAAASGASANELSEPLARVVRAVEAQCAARWQLARKDLDRVVEAYRAGQEARSRVLDALVPATRSIEAATRLAEETRARVEAISEGLERAEGAMRADDEAGQHRARSLEQALRRARQELEDLAEQARRATDASLREEARTARIAWKGTAPPVEAPRLDQWAEDLEETSRRLGLAVESAEAATTPLRSRGQPSLREALDMTVTAARARLEALRAWSACLVEVRGWAIAHEEGLSGAAARLRSFGSGEDELRSLPSPDGSLARTLEGIDTAAAAAIARTEVAVARTEALARIL